MGTKVHFKSRAIREYAREIAMDERNHVKFLRGALGGAAVSQPEIDLKTSFTAAARAAGLINSHQTFDPFANENNFLLGAFIFEDVGVTAYKGAAPLIDNATYLEAAAGILAVEAYHAGIVRSALYQKGLFTQAKKISDLRDAVDGSSDDDQNIRTSRKHANLVPTDSNSIALQPQPRQRAEHRLPHPERGDEGRVLPGRRQRRGQHQQRQRLSRSRRSRELSELNRPRSAEVTGPGRRAASRAVPRLLPSVPLPR